MYKEDTSFTIKTGVENMSPKEVVNLLRQTVWAKDRKKEAIIKSLNRSSLLVIVPTVTMWVQ